MNDRKTGILEARRQGGAALVIGLLLLLVLTILAISGMTTATLELQMAGNTQYKERAFQAAETGIEQAIDTATFDTSTPFVASNQPADGAVDLDNLAGDADDCETEDCYDFNMEFDTETGTTIVPGGGYSMGTGFQAYHFNIESTGRSRRGAEATHTQSIYIIGPGG
jgi:type II secretory pathway pseudopilin PulG